MMSLCSRPLALAANTSHLRISHFAARACSTGLRPPRILRANSALHPPRVALRPPRLRVRVLDDGKLPSGGGGCGGGGGGGSKPGGSGDEDDSSGEGFFGELNRIMKFLRRALQLGVLEAPLLATMHSWISISSEEMQSPSSSQSSNITHEITEMGDEESHCDGRRDDKLKAIMSVPQDNHSERSSGASSNRNKYSDRTAEMGTRTTNSQDHSVDMDEMEASRGYVFNIANSSVITALALLPYWGICCSEQTLSISKKWKDALYIGYIFLVIISIKVAAHSSRFKDGKLPVNDGFKRLEVVQLLLFLCLCVAAFIPQHVCRGVSNWVIWPCTAGALFMIVITWGTDFQKKAVSKCIKAPCEMVIKYIKSPCQMVIEYTKKKVGLWLPHLSLPECIKAKFKKMPEEQSHPGLPMGLV